MGYCTHANKEAVKICQVYIVIQRHKAFVTTQRSFLTRDNAYVRVYFNVEVSFGISERT